MVAPALAAAGISAVGSVVGGIAGGKGAKKAARIQQQTTQQQLAEIERNRQFQLGLNAPTMAFGGAADERIAALLGLGGDRAASEQAFTTWRDATGYQNVLDEGLRSANSARFAGGAGQSGSTLRRLQEIGSTLADRTFNTYMGHLGGVSAGGAAARGNVAGTGMAATNQFINATGQGAQGQIAAVNQGTANTQNLIQNLVNSGLYAYGSSYQPKPASPYVNGAMILPPSGVRSSPWYNGWTGG